MKYHFTKIKGKWLMAGIDDGGEIHLRVMEGWEVVWYYLNPFYN